MALYLIYGLVDPREPERVMVVGKTNRSLKARLRNYISDARRRQRAALHLVPSAQWIYKLLDAGVRPEIKLLEATDIHHWAEAEANHIALWREKNPDLLNVRNGGDGCDSAKVKLFCTTCGTRRRQYPSGGWYCPKCHQKCARSWHQTPEGREHDRKMALAYVRDRKEASKLGLTVIEYRARAAA